MTLASPPITASSTRMAGDSGSLSSGVVLTIRRMGSGLKSRLMCSFGAELTEVTLAMALTLFR